MIGRRWPLLAAAAVLVAGAAWSLLPRPRPADAVMVSKGPITQSVVASARVASVARLVVSSQAAARIDRILVREGDRVQAGQLLVRLRSDEAESQLVSARAALAEAEGRARLQSEVQQPVADQQQLQAQASLVLAEQEFARARDLKARGFVSQARVDEAERALATARAAEQVARVQAASNRERGVERELVRTRLEQARANVESARARLELLSLRAPADAVVLTRTAEEGDTAQVGRTLLELSQAGETRLIATVDEKNLRHLRSGLEASAVADAYPREPFGAEIVYVAPAVDAQRGTVEVRLRVDRPPAFLRPDMTVSVEVLVGRRESALTLPADALRGADSGAPWVLAVRDGRAAAVKVSTGLSGIGTVEVTEGLSSGDTVILPTAQVAAGDRVRPVVRSGERSSAGIQPVSGLTN